MNNIILSLKPRYAQAILCGRKRYEFRRSIFKKPNVKTAYIYVTSPIGKIVGAFTIGRILTGTPKEIWAKCRKYAGITCEEFFKYYEGCRRAFAIQIQSVQNFLKPLDPYLKTPNFTPPQSFYYLENDILRQVAGRTLKLTPACASWV
ncbi:MAG: ASCH domain-containing protein [Candidatus Micrarchaeota archaeon]